MPLNADRLFVAGKGWLDVEGCAFVRWKVLSSLKCRERILGCLRKQVGNPLSHAKRRCFSAVNSFCQHILSLALSRRSRCVTVICHIELMDMSRSQAELVQFKPLELNVNEFRSVRRNVNPLSFVYGLIKKNTCVTYLNMRCCCSKALLNVYVTLMFFLDFQTTCRKRLHVFSL